MDDEPGIALSTAHAPPEPWSHNLHYHRVILDAVPPGCRDALDVGCGTGALTRRLRAVVPHVTGIDRDDRSIEHARAHPGAADIRYVLGDFLTTPLEPESLDLVTSIAAVHHMDAEAALWRMAGLLRPGGVLAIVGLARGVTPSDLVRLVPAVAGTRWRRAAAAWRQRARRQDAWQGGAGRPGAARRDAWQRGAGRPGAARRSAVRAPPPYQPPIVWPPPLTYPAMRRLAARVLPGARFRRHLYWRYSLVWAKPGSRPAE